MKRSGDGDRLENQLQKLPGMAYRFLNLKHRPMDFVSDGCHFDQNGTHFKHFSGFSLACPPPENELPGRLRPRRFAGCTS